MFTTIQTMLSGKSQVIGATLAMLFGVGTEASGISRTGNTAIYVAFCGFAGAFIASLPKIIAARAHAKLSDGEFTSKQTRGLIDMLRKTASDNERILAIQSAVRHDIQGELQAARGHITLLEIIMREHDLANVIPDYHPADIRELLREMDRKILEIKEAPTSQHT